MTGDAGAPEPADLVIRGGFVVDGSGAPGRHADVAITDGVITAVGGDCSGRRELRADGRVVAPGFIDVHTHYDAQVFWDPWLTPSCWHGVTTVVAGNCGFTIAPCRPQHRGMVARTLERVEDMPLATLEAGIQWEFETFPEYLDAVERRGTALNFGAYVGHSAVRIFVLGDDAYTRAATPAEVAAMAGVVSESLEAGAIGFSTSLSPGHRGDGGRPVPSRWAEPGERETLMRVAGELDRGVVAIVQGSVGEETVPLAELYALQRQIGVPLTWVGFLADRNNDYYERVAELHVAERAAGSQVWPQTSCRTVTFQIQLTHPVQFRGPAFGEIMQLASVEQQIERYADPAWRDRAHADLASGEYRLPKWDLITVAESAGHSEHIGQAISELAAASGVAPLDFMVDTAIDDGLSTRFGQVVGNDDPVGVAKLLNMEGVLIGLSDAGAHLGQLCDACLPTDLLGTWVRERGVLGLEHAVRKLTGEPADVFGIAGRGYLRAGCSADVVVFDAGSIAPGPLRRVSDLPAGEERLVADQPAGITHVVVNGVPIVEDGRSVLAQLDVLPGQMVRSATGLTTAG